MGPAQVGWALLVIAAALVGGLAAAALVHTAVITAVIVSVVTGGIAILAVFRSPAGPHRLPDRAPRTPPAVQDPGDITPASFAPGRPADRQDRGGPPGGHQTAVQMLPLPAQPGQPPPDAPWWDSPQAPPPSPGAKRAPAPDLSTYLASTFIAQCPRCGAFRLDIRQSVSGWGFRCEACAHTWTWQPGTPWPPVRVEPRSRRE